MATTLSPPQISLLSREKVSPNQEGDERWRLRIVCFRKQDLESAGDLLVGDPLFLMGELDRLETILHFVWESEVVTTDLFDERVELIVDGRLYCQSHSFLSRVPSVGTAKYYPTGLFG